MARTSIETDLNLSDVLNKQLLMSNIAHMQGPYEIAIKPIDPKRSNQANRYWHKCVVQTFQRYMAAQGQHFTHDQCHEYLRDRFAKREPIFDPATGEVIDFMPAASSKMSKVEFGDLIEAASEWMRGMNIVVPTPEQYGVNVSGIKSAASH
jgi:hypothetical protein